MITGFIYNITFVISPKEERLFLDWVRESLLPGLFNNESPAKNAAIRKVIEAGGEIPAEDHGVSIAVHAEFDFEDDARRWHDIFLPPVLGRFTEKFGKDAVFFVTLLESLPL